jgi:6-methylsalicylate decarboxylase
MAAKCPGVNAQPLGAGKSALLWRTIRFVGLVGGPLSNALVEMLRRLYFDLAASAHHGALSAMLRPMPASQLLLGFDFPFMPPVTVAAAIASLDSFKGLSSDDQQAIANGNARQPFPKVGAR